MVTGALIPEVLKNSQPRQSCSLLMHANSVAVDMHDNSIIIGTINILEQIKEILQIPTSSYLDKYVKLLFLFSSFEMLKNQVAFWDCDSFIAVMSLFCTPQIWKRFQTLRIAFPMLRGHHRTHLTGCFIWITFFFSFFKTTTLNRPQIRINLVLYSLILIRAFKCWVCANPNGHANTLSQNTGSH